MSCRGFTLIEMIMVILLFSLLSVGIIKSVAQVSQGAGTVNTANIAIQLTQECAEYLLGLRRNIGYSMSGISNCEGLPVFGNNASAPTVTETVLSSADVYCPGTCKKYDIRATYGDSQAQASLLVVSF